MQKIYLLILFLSLLSSTNSAPSVSSAPEVNDSGDEFFENILVPSIPRDGPVDDPFSEDFPDLNPATSSQITREDNAGGKNKDTAHN